jgi:hypothetical protein
MSFASPGLASKAHSSTPRLSWTLAFARPVGSQ